LLIDFQPVPEFSEGQLLSANDLNTFNQNNVMITKLRASPQPLFMDSHAYAPKALPLYWRDPEFVIWEGSFIYREGMKYAYLGFQVKLDGVNTNLNYEYQMGQFGTDAASVNVGIITKFTEFSYRNLYNTAATNANYAPFIASAPLHEAKVYNLKPKTVGGVTTYTYRFAIKDGSANNVAATDGYLTKNARVSEIRIDLENLNLVDGELVPIRIYLLVNENPNKANISSSQFDPVYANFNNFFILRPKGQVPATGNPLEVSRVDTDHIFYSHLYAYTDGDLSYTDNWPAVSGVVVTGTGVLSTANMQKLTGKQRYITDRLKNRPMPLTGCILYLSAWGGTSSVRYPQYEVVPGQWEYSKEEYAQTISNSTDEFAIGGDNLGKLVSGAGRVNPQSNLATYAWNAALDLYNQPTFSFKYFGNTESRQVLIVDFTEAPVSQTSTRNNWLAKGSSTARSGHLFGYFDGGGQATHTGYYGSVYAAHNMAKNVSGENKKISNNHLFQVRIPSPNTRVYSPELGTYTNDKTWFFPRGFWEDQISVLFKEEKGVNGLWGLAKLGGYTAQYGFVSERGRDGLVTSFTGKKPIDTAENPEFDKQYEALSVYNNNNWAWKMTGGSKGYSQIFVNLYDHHSAHYRSKANYISYCFFVGVDDYKAADLVITMPTVYSGGSLRTYAQVKTAITTINNSLDENYTKLFTGNPHFTNYNMFWGAPKSPQNIRNIYKDYTDKFFFFTRQRTGNLLIVRGKNVTLYYGEIKKLERNGSPYGSLHKIDDVGVEFEYSENIISGDNEQTRILYLASIDSLAYGQRYYIQGDIITYAAEFFEEP
jgi:hypothetical protein